jgi:3-keto-5-aminohexanoate cleavage enzyme
MKDYMWDYTNSWEYTRRAARSEFPPMIITVAITGGVQGKESNINLPETPEEQAEQTYEAYKAGASMVHVHARDPERMYACTGDTEVYYNIHKLIRERCPDIIINDTTGGGLDMTMEEKLGCLDARPEVATLNLSPEIFKFKMRAREAPIMHPRPASVEVGLVHATFDSIAAFTKAMNERGVKPELEFYNPSNFYVMEDLIDQGLIKPPYLTQFVMGSQAAAFPTPWNLLQMVGELPPQSLFTTIGVAGFQLPMNMMGIILGGHVRVGMEDNVYYSRGRRLKNNAEAVERIVRIANELNREIATPTQAREMMGLSQTPTSY